MAQAVNTIVDRPQRKEIGHMTVVRLLVALSQC